MSQATVLYDVPGPRARRRNRVLAAVFTVAFAALAALIVRKLGQKDQWAAQKWEPFLRADIWTRHIIPGIEGTLKAAAIAAVLALAFGIVFGVARVSSRWWITIPAGTVVELFRAIPLLLLIFFASYVPGALTSFTWNPTALQAVVFGLTMYNGSVLAEVVRAGINATPKGQSEAGYAIGLRQGQLMRLILVPQAITAMMPAIVSQLVVLLKDTALGTIIAYDNLTSNVSILQNLYTNAIPAAIVIACVYIPINLALSWTATQLERRNRRRGTLPANARASPPEGGCHHRDQQHHEQQWRQHERERGASVPDGLCGFAGWRDESGTPAESVLAALDGGETMGKVIASITTSVDGYVTGPGDGPEYGLGRGGERLHYWVMGGPWTYDGGHDFAMHGPDKEFYDELTSTVASAVVGRGMYDAAGGWGGTNPFPGTLFVLTHRTADQPAADAGFRFVADLDAALAQAAEAAGDGDVGVGGGADVIRQVLAAGKADELVISTAPVILGGGKRLFDGFDRDIDLEVARVYSSPYATHVRYTVTK